MKRFLLFLVSIFFLGEVGFAQNYQANDSLYVWAVSGLSMRATPNLKGERIMTIPYGEKIRVDQERELGLTIKMIPSDKKLNYDGFDLKGNWRKVYFKDTLGYVFDGYLSRLPTIKISFYENHLKQQRFKSEENIMSWAERHYGLLNTLVENDSTNLTFERRYIYGNGIVIRMISWEKAGGSIITIPSTTVKEILLLYNITNDLERGAKLKDEGFWMASQSKTDPNQIDIYEGACSNTIRQIQGTDTIIIFSECSC